MAQRYDIVHIDFQANARNANAAIESIRQQAETSSKKVADLKKQLQDALSNPSPANAGLLNTLRADIKAAEKDSKQWNKAYNELVKGMRTLDLAVKAFNDGSLKDMSAAFQKTANNAAKTVSSKLDPKSSTYKKDKQELKALMDETQTIYARLQADTQQVLNTIAKGGKVSRQAITEELQQQRELLSVLPETDAGYKKAAKSVAMLDFELKKMGGSYEFIRQNISDTKKVSDETLRKMYTELEQVNSAEKVSKTTIRENKKAMRELRAEQENRVQNVLGGDLGKQSEASIRQAITGARELVQAYGSSSKKAQGFAALIVNAEEHLKTVGVEGARAAHRQAEEGKKVAETLALMQSRMGNVGKLSQSAFAETQKFWQEQLDGAGKSSKAYKEAERNLKTLAQEQERLNTEQLQKSAKQLNRVNLGKLSEQELTTSINAAKQLAAAMKPGTQAYADLVDNIVRAENHIKQFGLAGQRSSQQASEQMKQMNSRMTNLLSLSDSALEETRKFWQEQRDRADRGSKAYDKFDKKLQDVVLRQQALATAQNKKSANTLLGGTANLQTMGEGEIRKAIEAAREYQKTLVADSVAYTNLSNAIFGAEEYLRKYGIEADKAHLKEQQLKDTMTQRLTSLMSLSSSALAETKKFWQEQMQGAERASVAYKEAEANVKKITDVENSHKSASAMRVMAKPGNYSDAEIRQAVQAMEQLRDAQAHGSSMWERYNRLVQQGKDYLNEWAEADGVMKFEGQMKKLTVLSDSALAETKKFWAEMVAGAEKGTRELAEYEANLGKVTQEEQERAQIDNEMKAQKIEHNGGIFLGHLSEGEIRQAIEASKKLLLTYPSVSAEAKRLASDIAAAETYLSRYGLEAERTAARERESIRRADLARAKANNTMRAQLQQGTSLTETALKVQHQYWQRLIDDPKTAAANLKDYKDSLAEVERVQRQQVQEKGQQALDFFRGDTSDASANEIREQSEALKRYRDTLPSKAEADLILEINGYLAKTGQAAQSSAQQLMSLKSALSIGEAGLANSFKGTPQQLQQAKKVLQETLAQTQKGTAEYDKLRRALDGVALEEKRIGKISKEMDAILKEPKGRSFNELKIAVEQARKQLSSMSRTTKEERKAYDELAERIRNADLELKNLNNTSKGAASSFEKAISRLKTYITLYMGTAVAIQKLSGAMGDMMMLSDKMGEVRKTTGFTAEEVGKLSDNLQKLDTRTPLQNLMELSAAAGQLGLNTEEDVRGFTEAANEMMVALPELGQDGATEMMKVALATGEVSKIRKQMEQGEIQGSSATAVAMEKVASTIDRLRATTAAAASPVTDFVKRVGAVGAQSGITIDQVAALGATVDELGMGTEMAATAISRMIPAIKQNAFSVAQAIGVKPETITQLYDTGHAMDVILMILNHIKESNMNPDGVEKLLGTGGMADVMKELNQQGARAGIVFAGLSQNVDELERNIVTAKNAYQEGTAILYEYNKMNDTTAAKWERLKNQMQELLVNNTAQTVLGWIIDKMRWIVDVLTGNGGINVALRSTIGFLALTKLNVGGIIKGVKDLHGSLEKIKIMLGLIDSKSKKAAWTNVWVALAIAVAYCVVEFARMTSAVGEAYKALGKTREEIGRAEARFEGYWNALEQTNVALNKTAVQHRQLAAEMEKLRQASDQGSKATAQLAKKQDELKNSEKSVAKATAERRAAIGQINSIYGKYLGFLLTERNYALLAASAHDKITAAIEREMLVKQKQASIDAVDSKYSSKIADNYGKLNDRLVSAGGLSRSQSSSAMGALQTWMRQNIYYSAGKSFVRQSALQQIPGGSNLRGVSPNQVAAIWMNDYLRNHYHLDAATRNNITGVNVYREKNGALSYHNVYTINDNLRADYADTYVKRAEEEGAVSEVYNADINNASRKETNASRRSVNGLVADAKRARSIILDKKSSKSAISQAYGDLANALEGLDNNMQYLNPSRDSKAIAQLKEFATSIRKNKGINSSRLLKAQQNAHASMTDIATGNNDYSTDAGSNSVSTTKFDATEDKNPWGEHTNASSTDWSKFNADELVQRRKQMNEFVRALQGDTDVQSVLSQDPALMKAIKSGKTKSDSDSVIEWYNTQRLAIQNVLHSRHLTNTGDWQDPKKTRQHSKSIAKQAKEDMAYYLEELDAYYTEQKSRIEEAGNNGEITEEEGWRRSLQNEQVWRKRRAELQQLYTDKNKLVTQEEKESIFDVISDRTGDTPSFIGENINSTRGMIEKVGEKSMPTMRKIYGDLDKDIEQDFLKMRTALKRQLDAIGEIISKERPFDGIVKNLRQNVEKMGILYTDLDKRKMDILASGKGYGSNEMQSLNNEYAEQRPRRLTFLLQQSENAYNMTWERMASNMQAGGFEDWLSAINNDENAEELKEALLAQLHTVYDTVQDAIKKEASEVKKQVDITWNDTTLPGNISMKGLYEKASSALGIEQSSVSRANSLINAGTASEGVADRLAIEQMKVQLRMEEHRYALVRKIGQQRIDDLERQAELKEQQGKLDEAEQTRLDAKHAKMSLNLTLSEEETDLAKQREEINAKVEESEARLYTSLKEWGSLFASSVTSLFEASNTGSEDYYNNLAKMRLTGENSAGGTYVVIDNAGTENATAHYENLDGEDALKRQLQIEQQNATADAWKKVMDDINNKLSEQITDWLNASLQNQAVDANTAALDANTKALYASMQSQASSGSTATLKNNVESFSSLDSETSIDDQWQSPWQGTSEDSQGGWNGRSWSLDNVSAQNDVIQVPYAAEQAQQVAEAQIAASNQAAEAQVLNAKKVESATSKTNKSNESGTHSAFSKMAQAANMYGLAYQIMSNDNMTATQKFLTFALQSAGQTAIAMLTTNLAQTEAQSTTELPGILGKAASQLGPIAGPIAFAAMSALLGGLMAVAVSKVSKSKSQISQATGASVSSGRLSTGMLTYAEGNVNEFTNPSSLTPGQQYNVDAADGNTYRARYMGSNPTTHITNGPEFHLVGERGREAIIDADTTRQLQMNETGIWQAIQTLYNGGSVSSVRRNRSGMTNFASGNLSDFTETANVQSSDMSDMLSGNSMIAALQASLDRNSEVMEKAVSSGIKGVFNVYGKDGLIDSYDKGKKKANRYGEKY